MREYNETFYSMEWGLVWYFALLCDARNVQRQRDRMLVRAVEIESKGGVGGLEGAFGGRLNALGWLGHRRKRQRLCALLGISVCLMHVPRCDIKLKGAATRTSKIESMTSKSVNNRDIITYLAACFFCVGKSTY